MPKFSLDLHNILTKFNFRAFSVNEISITMNKLKFDVAKNQQINPSHSHVTIYEERAGMNFPDLERVFCLQNFTDPVAKQIE